MKRKARSTGLGSYDREYAYVEDRLADLHAARVRAEAARVRLWDAVHSGSASQAFKAKQSTTSALAVLSKSIETAEIAEAASGRQLDKLPRYGSFDHPHTQAHALMRAFRREIASARAVRSHLGRAAFGSSDEMRQRLSAERDARRPAARGSARFTVVTNHSRLGRWTRSYSEAVQIAEGWKRNGMLNVKVVSDRGAAVFEARDARRGGGARCAAGTRVQTLLLSRVHFPTEARAKEWARKHGFVARKVDSTANFFRLRQKEPGAFRAGSLRTIPLRPGVKAVVGCPKG